MVVGGAFATGILATGAVAGAKFNYEDAPPDILDKVRKFEAVCVEFAVPLAAVALQARGTLALPSTTILLVFHLSNTP